MSLHTCDSPIPQVCELIVFGWNQTSIDITLSGGSSGFHILWTTWSAGTNQMDGLPTPIYNLQPLFSTKQPLPSPMIYHNSSLVHPNPRQHWHTTYCLDLQWVPHNQSGCGKPRPCLFHHQPPKYNHTTICYHINITNIVGDEDSHRVDVCFDLCLSFSVN